MNSETIQPHAESESALRICSLLPSATEIAFALGLQNRLKAVTHECDFPPEARSLPAITSSQFEEEDEIFIPPQNGTRNSKPRPNKLAKLN